MKNFWLLIILILVFLQLSAESFDIHQIIEIGLKNSYDINTKNYSLRTAKQNLYSSYLDFVPTASYNISRTESQNSIEKSGYISISESFSSDDSRYFYTKKSLSSLRKSKIDLQITKKETVFQIIQYFLNVLQNQKLLDVSRKGVEISIQNFEETRILFSHGKVSDLDLQQSEINLSRAKIDSLKAKNVLKKSIMDLCSLINIEYKKNYEFPEFDYKFQHSKDFTFSEDNNLSINSAIENWKQAKIDYTQNKLNFLPSFSFSISKNFTWKEKNILDFDKKSSPLKYTLSLSYPLLSPITNLPTNLKHKYSLKQNQLSLNETRRKQKQNFVFLLSDFQQLQESLKLAEKQEELAKLFFKLTNEKYILGQVDITDLENARKQLFQSSNDRIIEYYNLIQTQEKLNLITNSKMLNRY